MNASSADLPEERLPMIALRFLLNTTSAGKSDPPVNLTREMTL